MSLTGQTDPSANQGIVPQGLGAKSSPHSDMPETTEDTRTPFAPTTAAQEVRAELNPAQRPQDPRQEANLGWGHGSPLDRGPITWFDRHFILQTCLQMSLAISRNEFHPAWMRFWNNLDFAFLGAADGDSGGPEGAQHALSSSSPAGTERRGTRASP